MKRSFLLNSKFQQPMYQISQSIYPTLDMSSRNVITNNSCLQFPQQLTMVSISTKLYNEIHIRQKLQQQCTKEYEQFKENSKETKKIQTSRSITKRQIAKSPSYLIQNEAKEYNKQKVNYIGIQLQNNQETPDIIHNYKAKLLQNNFVKIPIDQINNCINQQSSRRNSFIKYNTFSPTQQQKISNDNSLTNRISLSSQRECKKMLSFANEMKDYQQLQQIQKEGEKSPQKNLVALMQRLDKKYQKNKNNNQRVFERPFNPFNNPMNDTKCHYKEDEQSYKAQQKIDCSKQLKSETFIENQLTEIFDINNQLKDELKDDLSKVLTEKQNQLMIPYCYSKISCPLDLSNQYSFQVKQPRIKSLRYNFKTRPFSQTVIQRNGEFLKQKKIDQIKQIIPKNGIQCQANQQFCYEKLQKIFNVKHKIEFYLQTNNECQLDFKNNKVSIPEVYSESWTIFDISQEKSQKNWESHMISQRGCRLREIASLTKIMTCIVVFELMKELQISSDTQIKMGKSIVGIIGTSANLLKGDVLTILDLLYGLMLPSGNDAAQALANYFGKKLLQSKRKNNQITPKSSDSQQCFISYMNKVAKKLCLFRTTFANAHGLPNNQNVSCSQDIARLSQMALQNKQIAKIVSTKEYKCKIENQYFDQREITWRNTNKLLYKSSQIIGLKTGVTEKAGSCLSTYFKQDDHKIIIVILGTKDKQSRFSDSIKLLKWVLALKKIQLNLNQ